MGRARVIGLGRRGVNFAQLPPAFGPNSGPLVRQALTPGRTISRLIAASGHIRHSHCSNECCAMLHLARNKSSKGLIRPLAFTLVEVLVAVALLGLLAGSAIWTLTQTNSYAALSRLRTGAEIAAQNQVDLLLSDGPFNPQSGEVPAILTLSPPAQVETGIVIYSEPAGADGNTHAVTGTRTTTVTKVAPIGGVELNLYSATVVVTYTFRNKPYRVQLNAMRASDV